MSIAVAIDRQRIDRKHLVAGCDESTDQQPTAELDADDCVLGFLDVIGTISWSLEIPSTPSATRPLARMAPSLSMMQTSWCFSAQSIPTKTKLPPSRLDDNSISLEEIGGVLMDQCSTARHPTSPHLSSPSGGGTI